MEPGKGITIYPIQSPKLTEFDEQPDRWIDVRWDVIQEQWNVWAEHLGSELREFKAFVAGSIPTVGLAGVGLYTGIRKR